jgi:ATP-dependent DNA helicase DinG
LNACANRLAPGKQRPGQQKLTGDITATIETTGRLLASAPTGSGKALAQLCPATVAAWEGKRTVLSTATLALQAQILDKDYPLIAAICEQENQPTPLIAVHKGWSNYACLQAVCTTAGIDPSSTPNPLAKARKHTGNPATIWALNQLDDDGTGDKTGLPDDIPATDWDTISIQASECIGKTCPFIDECFPKQARRATSEADIIVTNHTLLAIQAATSAPIVTGNSTIGDIDILMVDECHALPDQIRSHGAMNLTGTNLKRVCDTLERVYNRYASMDTRSQWLISRGRDWAEAINTETMMLVKGPGVTPIMDDQPILEGVSEQVVDWCDTLSKSVRATIAAQPQGSHALLPMRRLETRVSNLRQAVIGVSEPTTRLARWVDNQPGGAVLKASPVSVADLMSGNLWKTPGEESQPVAVVCLSATVPDGFGHQTGLGVTTTKYESTFTETYFRSTCVYLPADGDVWRQSGGNGLDTKRHATWAVPQITALVTGNQGSALVLAATTENGKLYASMLRNLTRFTVFSQWDDRPVQSTINQWRADTTAVLVGTRSLMTGVDAPGDTCTLVIIDRVPRAAGNPVDDARLKDVQQRLNLDRWTADRLIYYGDAKLLLQQAVGRLIRRDTDHGMVAVLDPRLTPGRHSYNPATRNQLTAVFQDYGELVTALPEAVRWVESKRPG